MDTSNTLVLRVCCGRKDKVTVEVEEEGREALGGELDLGSVHKVLARQACRIMLKVEVTTG